MSADLRDVAILSVGKAGPQAAARLAEAIAVPIEAIVEALYRAPTRIAAGLSPAAAQHLARSLSEIGIETSVLPPDAPLPRPPLIDIAAEIVDPARADAAAEALGAFLGVAPPAALELMLTPPGLILGGVTPATLGALSASLPEGAVRLTSAQPDASRFALFAGPLVPAQRAAIAAALPAEAGFAPEGSVTAFGLSRAEAEVIWRRLGAHQTIRLVNEAFLRCDIVLDAAPPDAAAALEALAGVPGDVFDDLRAALPLTVEEGIALAEAPARLAAYAQAGLTARAELASFAMEALDILAAPEGALALAGLPDARAPLRTAPMPRPRARLLRARLEAAGAEVIAA
jgi:hypothetical protein